MSSPQVGHDHASDDLVARVTSALAIEERTNEMSVSVSVHGLCIHLGGAI